MDKKVLLAAAGSGKTSHIIKQLDLNQRTLLLTYTDNNLANLRSRIVREFGHLPANIVPLTYFSFLHGFCCRPYLRMRLPAEGITFEAPPPWTRNFLSADLRRYLTAGGRVYHCRMAKLLEVMKCIPDLGRRICRYFDALFVDEVQDFAGYDFDFLLNVCKLNLTVLMVGDFYQYTYPTSHDGTKNKHLHSDYEKYKQRFRDAHLCVDASALLKSHRCTAAVCEFIRSHLGIPIESRADRDGNVVFVRDAAEASRLHACPSTVKLFYSQHGLYACYSENWGASKGIDKYEDVCVVLNKTTLTEYERGNLRSLSPMTRNKLYVACSRARGTLYLVPDGLLEPFKSRRESA